MEVSRAAPTLAGQELDGIYGQEVDGM